MCLDSVHKENRPLSVGYKVMGRLFGGSLGGEFRYPTKARPMKRWLHADEYSNIIPSQDLIEATSGEAYKSGWHIFRKKKDALNYMKRSQCGVNLVRIKVQAYDVRILVRVKVRDIVASGLDSMGREIVVAKRILITGEVK